jgi:uncharacterized protein YheU (UPF0270 family)
VHSLAGLPEEAELRRPYEGKAVAAIDALLRAFVIRAGRDAGELTRRADTNRRTVRATDEKQQRDEASGRHVASLYLKVIDLRQLPPSAPAGLFFFFFF